MKKIFNFKRDSKGITLVALVITIIVLVILASVSINLVLGQTGIIGRAKEASEKQENAVLYENETLTNVEMFINDRLSTTTIPPTESEEQTPNIQIQTGTTDMISVAGNSANAIKVNLEKEMSDTNYYVSVEMGIGGPYFSSTQYGVYNKTTTSFDIMCWNNISNTSNVGFIWSVVGTEKENTTPLKLENLCGTTESISFAKYSGGSMHVTLPEEMKDTNYALSVEVEGGGVYWASVQYVVCNKTTTGFDISCWNDAGYTATIGSFSWHILGEKKTPTSSVEKYIQTGITDNVVIGANNTNPIHVTLPEEMNDTNYAVSVNIGQFGSYWASTHYSVSNKTTTGFDIGNWNNTGSAASLKYIWNVVGDKKVN